jgi:hypothetical protein
MIFRRIDNRIMGKVLLNPGMRQHIRVGTAAISPIYHRPTATDWRIAANRRACQVPALCKDATVRRSSVTIWASVHVRHFGMENSVSESLHPAAPHHLPGFITAPGETDVLMIVVAIILIGSVVGVGNLYLHLHTLPERMAHKSQKLQFEIVAVLGLLALFTHNHLFWVIGLFLAMIDLPDFGTPLRRIAGSVEKIAGVPPDPDPAETPTETAGHGANTNSATAKSEAPGHA